MQVVNTHDCSDPLAPDNGSEARDSSAPVQCIIFKSNDDMRQEMFAMQLIHIIRSAWIEDGLDLYLAEYRVLSTSPTSGFIEVVSDSVSIDALKKGNGCLSMVDHFEQEFGAPGSASHEEAVSAYISSLAAYSVLCYIMKIKDRHNGNILLQKDGHLVHIDFGFFLSIAPGGSLTLETAPFKFTHDFYGVVGPNVMTNPRWGNPSQCHLCCRRCDATALFMLQSILAHPYVIDVCILICIFSSHL
jgi:hypothetical protein